MVYDDLRDYLISKTAITNEVSTRVYPLWLPESANLPAIVFWQESLEADHKLGGAAGVAYPVFRFDCIATTLAKAIAIGEALRSVLHGYSGAMDQLQVLFCKLVDESDQAQPPQDGSDTWTVIRSVSFQFKVRQSIPSL